MNDAIYSKCMDVWVADNNARMHDVILPCDGCPEDSSNEGQLIVIMILKCH